jgi:hypothetical protein
MKEKTLYFCTLFDSNYLTRGLAMYLSLKKSCPNFVLYIIAFDDICLKILFRLKLENVVVISLAEFENEELLKVKPTRTRQEYCWTCSSSSILYCIQKYDLEMCVYIDADMIFFEDPQVILDEMGDKSILLTEHRLPEEGNKIEKNGRYCVQFMPFKNTLQGMTALTWWTDRCIEWCFNRFEDGKLGDQKYLNDWTTRFSGVHIMEHLGGGVAPWNMYRYNILDKEGKLVVKEKKTEIEDDLVFYHFQSTKLFYLFGTIIAVYWPYDSDLNGAAKKIYQAYNRYLSSALVLIRMTEPGFDLGFYPLLNYFKFILRKTRKDLGKVLLPRIKMFLQ